MDRRILCTACRFRASQWHRDLVFCHTRSYFDRPQPTQRVGALLFGASDKGNISPQSDVGNVAAEDRPSDAPRGRYSGQVLRPHQLLVQLGEAEVPKRRNDLRIRRDAGREASAQARPRYRRMLQRPIQSKSNNGEMSNVQTPASVVVVSDYQQFLLKCKRDLDLAVEQHNVRAAQKVREDMRIRILNEPGTTIPLWLYDHAIWAFSMLRQLQDATGIWKDLTAAGYSPTVKTYTSLIRGAHTIKDSSTLEAIWDKMRSDGIQPDAHAWSARLHGLFKRSSPETALAQLKSMGREWLHAAKNAEAKASSAGKRSKQQGPALQIQELLKKYEGDIDGVARPTVAVLNAAITALASSDDSLVSNVLSWGRAFGIEPDIVTYNTLYNLALRHGRAEEALDILKIMQRSDIGADGTTWTISLSGMFESGQFDGLDEAAQERKILELINSLESGDVAKIDQKGYALIFDRLLKKYNNRSAAKSVLAHMNSRGVQPTPHIYTILMSAYFSQVPPDFAAIDSLWAQIRTTNNGRGTPLDSQFYDRMLEGYATHHAALGTTAPIFSLLDRMESEGKLPSWHALEHVARALEQTQDWDHLISLVDRVRRRVNGQDSHRIKFGQRSFWQFIVDTGMLKDEGVYTVDQALRLQ